MTPSYVDKVESYIHEMWALSKRGDMFAEAQAQWLESCMECPDCYQDDLLDDVKGDALYWLEGLMGDSSDEDLAVGGAYHWMTIATAQADAW